MNSKKYTASDTIKAVPTPKNRATSEYWSGRGAGTVHAIEVTQIGKYGNRWPHDYNTDTFNFYLAPPK